MAASFALGHYDESARYILTHAGVRPRVGLILGSGLGKLVDAVENPVALPFADIPHFVASTVPGHSGKLVLGTLRRRRSASCRAGPLLRRLFAAPGDAARPRCSAYAHADHLQRRGRAEPGL